MPPTTFCVACSPPSLASMQDLREFRPPAGKALRWLPRTGKATRSHSCSTRIGWAYLWGHVLAFRGLPTKGTVPGFALCTGIGSRCSFW